MRLDRWDALILVGAASLGGGVWALAGGPYAFVLWGVIALALAAIHEVMPGYLAHIRSRDRGQE
jgi:hypothetical protein